MSSKDVYGKILEMRAPRHEADDVWNDLQRELVAEFYKEHPGAYVGVINRYDPGKKLFYPYNGEKVYNFDIVFIVPGFDETLLRLLEAWDKGERTGSLAGQIYDRIQKIGGFNLSFS